MQDPHFPWRRYFYGEIPIYFSIEEPNWFVPNRRGDEILQGIAGGRPIDGRLDALRLLSRIPQPRPAAYPGRADVLKPERISELWFHLTNRCNMACGHCLFSSSPTDTSELPASRLLELAAEAYHAGCRLFALTGGEPLVHPNIDGIVRQLLDHDGSHVVLLTNGLALVPFLERLRPDPERFHLQISLDGMAQAHDRLRGRGAFSALSQTLRRLQTQGVPFTVSMCVTAANVRQMPDVVDFAAGVGAGNVHFMWYFVRGRGKTTQFADIDTINEMLVQSAERAARNGVAIDNLEALKTQVFAPAGTIHDGGTAAWESLAVGPDGRLYPSAALVGVDALASDLSPGLVHAWRHSPVLKQIRAGTVRDLSSPLRFLLGGGDIDHSYLHKGTFLGDDPYEPLYQKLALWLIAEEAKRHKERAEPGLRLQMGEILKSCGAHGRVALVHSNCLLATAQADSLTTVKEFYAAAAAEPKTEILNPVCYDPQIVAHIPEAYRFRGYGCGSPVLDAEIKPGERVVDLGCGRGVECFIAARLTGKAGRVIGVDMLDPMLGLAREGQAPVAENLGYDILDFRKGYLEALPVESASVDVVISNCVMNLSVDKRQAYAEIHRILRPGGRLVISDVVCDSEPDPAIRNDEVLKGECIAGALSTSHLAALLEETDFEAVTLIKRFPYREVDGHPFFSLTYSALKPRVSEPVTVIYRGPLPFLVTREGRLLQKGAATTLDRQQADLLGEQVFVVDAQGTVLNIEAENTCACYSAPEKGTPPAAGPALTPLRPVKQANGCMLCGAPLVYRKIPVESRCEFCGMTFSANSVCENGHFVCDRCHAEDAIEAIGHICRHTEETDMLRLFAQIRRHPAVPMHGPEYHAMVPGVILATYRNSGGDIARDVIESGIERGRSVAGGFCGFMGVCGAAVGVGIAFSLMIGANPTKARERRIVQGITQRVLAEIAKLKAARCCQRDGWIALSKAAELSASLLPVTLKADYRLVCSQQDLNKECLGKACRLHPLNVA
jgi:MoaA/NifB/PqqE/SkfB family radical SAM enzyme/2-polyprenyl-3-methyl-5-hydroxy-6-metoxy-1,4-benzoquinol methylase